MVHVPNLVTATYSRCRTVLSFSLISLCMPVSNQSPPLFPVPGNHWSDVFFIVFTFPECPINGIMKHEGSWVWLLSCSIMHWDSSTLLKKSTVQPFLLSTILFHGYTSLCLFIHPVLDIWVVSSFLDTSILTMRKLCLHSIKNFSLLL